MSGHYEEREIKVVEVTYVSQFVETVTYELRAYYNEGHYEVLHSSHFLEDIFKYVK